MDYLRVVVEVNIDDGGGYTNYSRKQSTWFTIDMDKVSRECSLEIDKDMKMDMHEKNQESLNVDISDNVEVNSVMCELEDEAEEGDF